MAVLVARSVDAAGGRGDCEDSVVTFRSVPLVSSRGRGRVVMSGGRLGVRWLDGMSWVQMGWVPGERRGPAGSGGEGGGGE